VSCLGNGGGSNGFIVSGCCVEAGRQWHSVGHTEYVGGDTKLRCGLGQELVRLPILRTLSY
jgi:hypothetical protein